MPRAPKDHNRDTTDEVLMLPSFPIDPTEKPETWLERFPEHARYIGMLIGEWSILENKLAVLTALYVSKSASVILPMIYAVESSHARLESMRGALSVVLANHPKLHAETEKLFDVARGMLTQRNKYAHALYGRNRLTGDLIKVGTRGDPTEDVPLHVLKHQFERMKAHAHAVGVVCAVALHERKLLLRLPAPPSAQPEPQNPKRSSVARKSPSPPKRPQSSPKKRGRKS
jgi:hypothetical protein